MSSLAKPPISVLVFSRTRSASHPSSETAIAAIERLGADRGWTVNSTEHADQFSSDGLEGYDVVVWLSASSSTLNSSERLAYEEFHRRGKGTVAIHLGGHDTETDGWPWYRELASTTVTGESINREVTLLNSAPTHPAMCLWPTVRRHSQEWHKFSPRLSPEVFAPDPESDIDVLLWLYDAITYPETGYSAPAAWCREFEGGRYFYTALGGSVEEYSDPVFLAHVAGGIEWAAGRLPDEVVRVTDGDALILTEFDGASPNGSWHRQEPSPDFGYSVTPSELRLDDSTAISKANRHLVRDGIAIDPRRPYAIEGRVTFPGPFDPGKSHSFVINLNNAGPDGDYSRVNTWSVNILPLADGKSITLSMGFIDGGFFQIGQISNDWGEAFGVDKDYDFRVYVNADLLGLPQPKRVSMTLNYGDLTLQEFSADYSPFPYQPDESKPVRVGFNSHGASWVLRDLKVYYLDVFQRVGGALGESS